MTTNRLIRRASGSRLAGRFARVAAIGLLGWATMAYGQQAAPSPLPPFFTGETQQTGANDLYFLGFYPTYNTFFGYYYFATSASPGNSASLYHYDMGTEWYVDANDSSHGIYFYDQAFGHWFYTTPAAFPFLYDYTFNAWLWYDPNPTVMNHYTSNPRWFYNMTTQTWNNSTSASSSTDPIPPVTPDSVGINGGTSNTGSAPVNTAVTFAFTYHDQPSASYIVLGDIDFRNPNDGSQPCSLSWSRSSNSVFGVTGSCAATLLSIANSSSDPSLVTVTISITFEASAAGFTNTGLAVETSFEDYTGLSSGTSAIGTFTVLAPSISSISPASGPAGTQVTIYGSNFGNTGSPGQVTFAGTQATSFWGSAWGAGLIQVVVPAGAGSGTVQVSVNGYQAAAPQQFQVGSNPAPSIINLSLTQGPPLMGFQINGSGFGATKGASTVKLGTADISSSVITWSAGMITVQVPAGTANGNNLAVVVTVSGVPSNPVPFTVSSTFGCAVQ